MFRNYLITAYKVLLRRKFFSFVNIFGIALTLAVITVVIAMLQNVVQPLGAEARAENYLGVRDLMITNEEQTSTSSWAIGYRFLETQVMPLETPDRIAFFAEPREGTVFVRGQKVSPRVVRANHEYWNVLAFDFRDGRPFANDEVSSASRVAVINEAMQVALFDGNPAVGKRFDLDGMTFEVIGVVANEPETRLDAFGEIWIPYTATATDGWRKNWIGPFSALLYAEDRDRLPVIRDEFTARLETFVHDDPEEWSIAKATANSKLEALAREFLDRRFAEDSRVGLFFGAVFAAMVAFMFLPTINLINLNVSRILERAGEIGVRKAFGASTRTLVGQFLVENLVLSFVGGILGVILGFALLAFIESTGMIAYAQFQFDVGTVLAAFAMIVVFAVLSGLYPALRMARMHPVGALRRG
ncbi:MAG: FtsX-like permease family protein [Pseudomonadota bacterium]